MSFVEFRLENVSTHYHLCDVHSSPCCLSGLNEEEVKQAIGKRCDEEFETGCWVLRPLVNTGSI
jgi:hypothetical protein